MAFYRLSAAAKLSELRSGLGPGVVEKLYAEMAEQLIAAYERDALPRAEPSAAETR
jgi:hypothetical protein